MANGENLSNWINNIGGTLSNFSYTPPEPPPTPTKTIQGSSNTMLIGGVVAVVLVFLCMKK